MNRSFSKKIIFLFLLAAFLLFGCTNQPKQPPVGIAPNGTSTETYHVHADFLVVLDGSAFDFNKAEYMSTPYKELSEDIHLHDFNPNVIHVHKENATLGEFFETIGIKFDENCFDAGKQKFCNSETKKLQLFVDGKPNEEFESFKPKDLERILIFFGQPQVPQLIIESVSKQACIYSEKCAPPPGFKVEPENCSVSRPCELPK